MPLAAELSGASRHEQHQAADGKAFQLPPERLGGGWSPLRAHGWRLVPAQSAREAHTAKGW
jgi:hypothetical protein